MLTQRQFLRISQLQLCENGINATPRLHEAVDAAVRESTGLAREYRDGVRATQDMEAVFWLEDYLAGWSKILFFVSHSQDFMNGVCTHIVRCRASV